MTKHERAIAMAKSAYASHYHSGGMEAAIAAYLAAMRVLGEGEVRVRVCVGVSDCDGAVARHSEPHDMGDRWARAAVIRDSVRTPQIHFLEGNVPAWKPPAEETVEGERVP